MHRENMDNGVLFNFASQSVAGSSSWKLKLDELNLEIRSNFLALRTIKQFSEKITD